MIEHFFKLHFCMFEKSQGMHNNLDYHYFFGIFSINCKVHMFKAWHIWKMFLQAQITQTWRVDGHYFFQTFFFLPNVHHSLWKLERILTLMIIKEKRFEPMKIVYITNLNTFGSNVLLTLKIMSFENVVLAKVVHIYVIEGMNA